MLTEHDALAAWCRIVSVPTKATDTSYDLIRALSAHYGAPLASAGYPRPGIVASLFVALGGAADYYRSFENLVWRQVALRLGAHPVVGDSTARILNRIVLELPGGGSVIDAPTNSQEWDAPTNSPTVDL